MLPLREAQEVAVLIFINLIIKIRTRGAGIFDEQEARGVKTKCYLFKQKKSMRLLANALLKNKKFFFLSVALPLRGYEQRKEGEQ
jgi:hypothetical protein